VSSTGLSAGKWCPSSMAVGDGSMSKRRETSLSLHYIP
jgi:hypothetical protein